MRHFRNTKSKYNSKKTVIDGLTFDSKAEAECFQMLKLMERNGQCKVLEVQPKVYMTDAKILFKLDFLIEEGGEQTYIDVKGVQTPVFNIKKRLWRFYGKGKLRTIKKDGIAFRTIEEIVSQRS